MKNNHLRNTKRTKLLIGILTLLLATALLVPPSAQAGDCMERFTCYAQYFWRDPTTNIVKKVTLLYTLKTEPSKKPQAICAEDADKPGNMRCNLLGWINGAKTPATFPSPLYVDDKSLFETICKAMELQKLQ